MRQIRGRGGSLRAALVERGSGWRRRTFEVGAMGESRCWNKVVEVGLTVDEEYSFIAASRDFDAG